MPLSSCILCLTHKTVSSYPLAVINAAIAIGLVLLYTPAYRTWKWNPPVRAPKWAVVFFMLSNFFLVVAPLVPPARGTRLYAHLPYWVRTCSSFFFSSVTNIELAFVLRSLMLLSRTLFPCLAWLTGMLGVSGFLVEGAIV
jgi:hypothetical protein